MFGFPSEYVKEVSCGNTSPPKEKKIDFNSLPKAIAYNILSYLNAGSLARSQELNRNSKVLGKHEALWKKLTPKMAFGKEQWAKYFGDVGNEPPLPKNIDKILESDCPFFPGKKVADTHMLVLIPETVNGQPLNLETLGTLQLSRDLKDGGVGYFRRMSAATMQTIGKQTATRSHWALMAKDVIEGSRNKTTEEQLALIKQKGINYEIPKALDAAVCIFMHYVSSEERLFSGEEYWWTETSCQEKVQDCTVAIGAFTPVGLSVRLCRYKQDADVGVAPIWTLS